MDEIYSKLIDFSKKFFLSQLESRRVYVMRNTCFFFFFFCSLLNTHIFRDKAY